MVWFGPDRFGVLLYIQLLFHTNLILEPLDMHFMCMCVSVWQAIYIVALVVPTYIFFDVCDLQVCVG